MQVVYVPNLPPARFSKSIFLAGPSPRDPAHPNWRPEALELLEKMGFDGVVFVPLPGDGGDWRHGYDAQIEWELAHLNMADVVVFWVPRHMETLPALTTNVEFGMLHDSGKVVLGYPEKAPSMRYLAHLAKKVNAPVFLSMEETLRAAVDRIGVGAEREGGERMVPLHVWRLPHFQSWIQAQKRAGNRLDGARLLWSFLVEPAKSFLFAYALYVDIYIASEGRSKTNEFIIARPDIATTVAYRKRSPLMDTEVVLIREFRSPARTLDGFIREVPGGSSWRPGEDPRVTTTHELSEEIGLEVNHRRLRAIGMRQPCGTLSAHQANVFALEITEEELMWLRKQEKNGLVRGVVEDTERTYTEVHRLGDLLDPSSNAVDWSMIGMIVTAVMV